MSASPFLLMPDPGNGGEHSGGAQGADLVGDSGAGVRFVDDDGNAASATQHSASCREVCGERNITTEADDDVCVDSVEHVTGAPDGLHHSRREREEVERGFAGQRHRGDQFERVPAARHQCRLEAT